MAWLPIISTINAFICKVMNDNYILTPTFHGEFKMYSNKFFVHFNGRLPINTACTYSGRLLLECYDYYALMCLCHCTHILPLYS